jgi:23S rRNA pseudouridine2605 synthase
MDEEYPTSMQSDVEYEPYGVEPGPPNPISGGVRLQKVLAGAGLGSRRACEELIAAGRVEVDGRRVTEQGMRVDPEQVQIRVDGTRVSARSDTVYLVLNKPVGVVSTMSDPEGRPCIGDYLVDRNQRLFHVGRLDTDTEGLILLTNDGDLAHRLTHPSFGVTKTYVAEVPGPIAKDLGNQLRRGIELEDGPVKVDRFRMLSAAKGRVMVEVMIHEGRQHIVRRLLAAVGHPASRLIRTEIGSVTTGNLAPGRMRHLTSHEVSALMRAAEPDQPPKRSNSQRSARKPTKRGA